MQTTLLGLAIACILALLTALVGPYFVDWNDHRAYFQAEASRLVGLDVRVAGMIDVKVLPTPSVTLGGIAIGPVGEASRVRARSLRIELELGPLMRGELRAVEMRLVGPEINIGLNSLGQIDWPAMALSTETLSIDRLSIEDGRATLTDALSNSRFLLEKVYFTGEVRSLAGPIRGKGEFVSRGELYGYSISAGRYETAGMRLRFGLNTDERPLSVEADGMLAFDRSAPSFEGNLVLARPAGSVGTGGKAVAHIPWRLTSKVKTGKQSAKLDEVSFQYGPDDRATKLGGEAELKFGEQPRLDAVLSTRQLDLDRLLVTADSPRTLPFPAVQALSELLGGALRPSLPVKMSIGIDAATLGGATLQGVGGDLRSDGNAWYLDKLEFRAPGFTQVRLSGRLDPVGKGIGFSGAVDVDANDPKMLVAWIAGRSGPATGIKPWHAKGEVTLSADRIAVERLRTDIDRGTIEGRLAYLWPASGRPARLDAELSAAEIDLDAVLGFGDTAFSGLGLERPGEMSLALDIGRTRIAGYEAQNTKARLKFDSNGIAIERLSVRDFGDASIEASGRIQTTASPSGHITVNLDARDIAGIVALAEIFSPPLAGPLRQLAGRQKSARLIADLSLQNIAPGSVRGQFGMTGRIGPVRVNLSAGATGKPEAFVVTDLRGLADADVRLEGQIDADDGAALLTLVGLDRVAASDKRPARLTLLASGLLNRELRFDGKLKAGPLDVGGKGTVRFASDQRATLNLDQLTGTIAGNTVKGQVSLGFGDVTRVDGTIEADAIDVPATIAAAIGMPVRSGQSGVPAGWPTEPFALGASDLIGRIEFKAARAAFSSTLVARQLHGVARFGPSDVTFEGVEGELAKGRFSGRASFASGPSGLSARASVALNGGEASEIFTSAGRPLIGGRVMFSAEVEGSGRSPAAFIGSLTGKGLVSLDKGQLAGLNPRVFDAVTRAVDLGIQTNNNRIRDFVGSALDTSSLPVSHAEATININAGQARFSNVVARTSGADLEITASVDLANASLDALLTLTGAPNSTGSLRPAVLVALKGALPTPARSIDTRMLASWLALRSVDQQSKRIDAIEKGREPNSILDAVPPTFNSPAAPMPEEPATTTNAVGRPPAANTLPPLPPPVTITPVPRPRQAPRAENTAPHPQPPRPAPPPRNRLLELFGVQR